MNIVSLMFASPAYDELVNLRLDALYKPLGAEVDLNAFAEEYKDVHLAVYDAQNRLIGGTIAMVSEEEDEMMNKRKICLLKQVVIRPDLQGLGMGRDVLATLEQLLIQKGYKEVRLYAHVGALDFYRKYGYDEHGKSFVEHGIEQHIMKKKIQKKSDKLDHFHAEGAAYS